MSPPATRLSPLALAASVTARIGFGAWLEPHFAGAVEITRALRRVFSGSVLAAWVSRIASAPAKYRVLGAAGWRVSLVAIGVILLDQCGSECRSAITARPRPWLLVLVEMPRASTCPSGTLAFFSLTLGWLAVLAVRRPAPALSAGVLAVNSAMIVLACAAPVVVGAQGPGDTTATVVTCMM